MNKFERLFFILEKYDDAISQEGPEESKGVVKATITDDAIRLIVEAFNLPEGQDIAYGLTVFFKEEQSREVATHFIELKGGALGSIQEEISLKYEGNAVVGAAVAVYPKNIPHNRKYPLISFKIENDEWKRVMQNLRLKDRENAKSAVKAKEEFKEAEKKENIIEIKKENKEEVIIVNKTELFYENFITFDPFDTTNRAYKWWRAPEMHQVNKVLLEAGIKVPFELNKDGYLACETYGHILLGLYMDKTLKREFFILGMPAKEKRSAGNYYLNSRWEETAKPQSSGENGYWLTYIDCDTSKVVKVI